jgi:hypothetical protein
VEKTVAIGPAQKANLLALLRISFSNFIQRYTLDAQLQTFQSTYGDDVGQH